MKPLDCIEEVINWDTPSDKTECCGLSFIVKIVQENSGLPAKSEKCRQNKVLFCHDMKGGYLDDSILEGNDNVYAYRFYYWNLIDIFVYFSHHFVSIPPTGWIHQAHKNGVQCLGTLIIEPGEHLDNFLKLFDSDNIEMVAHKLNEIRKFYNFEGWLVNLECSVEETLVERVVANICKFLDSLTEMGNEVVWYDAVTVSGRLAWQNCLNNENRLFYDHCGSIFTNYCWDEVCLRTSLLTSAGHGDTVFVGIDCFGRGCPGGGQLNCKSALDMIEKASSELDLHSSSKLSIALFAPGWCYESVAPSDREKELDDNIWLFFHLMTHYLDPFLDGRRVYRQLPEMCIEGESSFSTNFDLGQGYSSFVNGCLMESRAHNCLMDQQVTPSGRHCLNDEDIVIKLVPCRSTSFSGHSCVKMLVEIDADRPSISVAIVVELFRLGCHILKKNDAILHLWLGQLEDVNDEEIWMGLRVKLTFSIGTSDLEFLDYKLVDVLKRDDGHARLPVKWRHFTVKSLYRWCHISPGRVTLRKIELVIEDTATLERLSCSSLYFGMLTIDPMY